MTKHKQKAIEAYQASAPGVCTQSVDEILAVDKFEWNIEETPSGGIIGVVLAPKSHGKWRLFGVGFEGATEADAVAYAKQVIGERKVYAYDPGVCEYNQVLTQLPVEIRGKA